MKKTMADLKLAKLPDRTPVKLTITITPDLQAALQSYANLFAANYGVEEPITELIPAMLSAFLESDRSLMRRRIIRDDGRSHTRLVGSLKRYLHRLPVVEIKI